MNQRDTVAMGEDGVAAFLTEGRKVQVAPKRTAYLVQPLRVANWDHRRLSSSVVGTGTRRRQFAGVQSPRVPARFDRENHARR